MKSLWVEEEFASVGEHPLDQCVFTTRLLGREPSLVLHGGGNTSVKMQVANVFGENEQVIYVTGSGIDLRTIDRSGFSPVNPDVLRRMATLEVMSDEHMVGVARSATLDANAPNPSVEAILHAIIPFKYVDHTHADAVVTITNTEQGIERLEKIYGDRMFIVPYVMPGFLLAKEIYEMTRDISWDQIEGMILLNHGVFTFGDDATTAYMRMIQIVTLAEDYLEKRAAVEQPEKITPKESLEGLAELRRAVSHQRGGAVVTKVDAGLESIGFSSLPNVEELACRGPLTPDHVTWTKRVPVVVGKSPGESVNDFAADYSKYFDRNTDGTHSTLDPAPRWAVWPDHGVVSFGRSYKEATVVSDIVSHTITAIRRAEKLGGWKPLPEDLVFAVEYWRPQMAKLTKWDRPQSTSPLAGKVAIVTGGASGIGRACVELFNQRGAAVVALDVNPDVAEMFEPEDICGLVCDVTDSDAVSESVDSAVRRFGGVDVLVSNAGAFPESQEIAALRTDKWRKSMDVNLSSHQFVLRSCIPYLQLGVEPAVVIVGSKNVPAPGHGAAAYSVAKAGLTQLARVAALELGPKGIRVNTLHPDHVFDTALWSQDVLESRAKHYRMTVEEYKTRNLLGVEISSRDVAELACALAGTAFSKTTGAQVPIDGGNDRVI